MPLVLPIFPLYPSPSFLQYNVSLAIPGPKLWDLPKIGEWCKENNYPNTQAAILIPDIEYIKRFANYELGIADSMLKATQQQNISKIKPENALLKKSFDDLFGSQNLKTGAFRDGMGFKSMEKTILASAFETQKPYFEIAQIVIKSIVKVEDIIARICPIFGAAVNPTMALAIKSRKPKGNGPQSQGSVFGPYGTPQALGYKSGQEVQQKIDKLKTQLQKGAGVKIDKNGKFTRVPKQFNNENTDSQSFETDKSLNNIQFTYVTISTIYSTGVFDEKADYLYKYIDIEADEPLPEVVTPPEPPEPDLRPERIIFGIFKNDGTPMDPSEKIKYWAPTTDGLDLEIKDSIFERAPWIKREKWIFNKSIDYPNMINWKMLDTEMFIWRKNGVIKKQLDNPDPDNGGWERLKYKDVIDFGKEENQYLKYKEDDYITEFTQGTIMSYRNYYNFLIEKAMNKFKVPPEDRPEVMVQVEKIFSEKSTNDKILEQIQNLIKFGDFKQSYYNGVDREDWKLVSNLPRPTANFPDALRKIFIPMRFNINNQVVWIDPDDDYDLKVIRIVPNLKLDYTSQETSSNDTQNSASTNIKKNSDIKSFIKNKLKIIVTDGDTNQPVNFNMKKYRTTETLYSDSVVQETFTNIESYSLNNWNINFDTTTGDKQIDNSSFAIKLYFNSQSGFPTVIKNLFNKEYSGEYRYYPRSGYADGTNGLNTELKWSTLSFTDNINAFLNAADRANESDSAFNNIMSNWGLDWNKEKFQKFIDNSEWVVDKINELGNVSVESEVTEYVDRSTMLYSNNSDPQFQDIEYVYIKREVLKPFELADAIINLFQAVENVLTLNLIKATDNVLSAIQSFKDAKTSFYYYKRSVFISSETTTTDQYKMWEGQGRGKYALKLENGTVKEFTFWKGVIEKETDISLGYLINSNSPVLPENLLSSISGKALPLFGIDSSLTFKVGKAGEIDLGNLAINYSNLNQKSSVSRTSQTLSKFQISVFEQNGANGVYKNISSSNYGVSSILNYRLQDLGKSNISYSKGRYGSGWKGGPVKDSNGKVIHIEPDNPQYVGWQRRGQLTELDLESYYIIEGIKKKEDNEGTDQGGPGNAGQGNPNSSNGGTSGGGGGGGGFYRMPAAVGIAKVMIELVIEISIKLFPAINKLIALIKNPASFFTEIIKAKLEDHFIIFNPRVTSIMNDVAQYSRRVKSAKDYYERTGLVDEMRRLVKSSELANYLHVDDLGEFRLVIDGPALIGFFGILFGLELNLTKAFNGGIPIKPIFQANPGGGTLDQLFGLFDLNKKYNKPKIDNIYGYKDGKTDEIDQKELEDKVIKNLDLTKPDEEKKNEVKGQNGETQYYEEVSITYSTGKFIEGVDYKYIYLDQQIEGLIKEGDELVNKESEIDFSGNAQDSIDNLSKASEKYQQAYDLLNKHDKSKDSLKKTLLEKIKALKGKINIVSQPLFKLILGIVTLPIKVIFGIIKWLIDFFKQLVNPVKFPGLMIEFLSFKWIMQFFTPKGLLELAGIKFKPEKLVEWCIAVNIPNPLNGSIPGFSEYLIPDDYIIADLNEFLDVGFEAKLPIYTAKQYRDLCLRPFRLFNVFLCFIEKIVNAFIMLIWAIMGITAVIPPPLLKLCKRLPENMDPKDLQDVVNGMYKDDDLNIVSPNLSTEDLKKYGPEGPEGPGKGSYDFIYEIKLPDGTIKKDLNRDQVQKIMNDNKELNFDFLNFETLE
jgi:hypothetical protein